MRSCWHRTETREIRRNTSLFILFLQNCHFGEDIFQIFFFLSQVERSFKLRRGPTCKGIEGEMRRSKIWPQLDYDLEENEEYVAPKFTCASFMKAILAVLCWMVLNMSLSLLNKYFFQEKARSSIFPQTHRNSSSPSSSSLEESAQLFWEALCAYLCSK